MIQEKQDRARTRSRLLLDELAGGRDETCDTALCLRWIRAGADMEMRDKQGNTALDYAVLNQETEIVAALLEHGAPPNATDDIKWTPLMEATISNSVDIIHLLVQHGADINATDYQGWTALMHAGWYGVTSATRDLLEHDADARLKTKDDKTAWDLAADHGHHDIAKTIHNHHIRKTFTAAAEQGTTKTRKIRRPKLQRHNGI